MSSEGENMSEYNSTKLGWGIALFLGVVLILLSCVYVCRFGDYPIGSHSAFGEFGDFFGGILNPLIGMVTAFFLYSTLRAQQDFNEKQNKFNKQQIQVLDDERLHRKVELFLEITLGHLKDEKEISSKSYAFCIGDSGAQVVFLQLLNELTDLAHQANKKDSNVNLETTRNFKRFLDYMQKRSYYPLLSIIKSKVFLLPNDAFEFYAMALNLQQIRIITLLLSSDLELTETEVKRSLAIVNKLHIEDKARIWFGTLYYGQFPDLFKAEQ